MGKRAFMIAADRAAVIANDVSDFRYRAATHYLPIGVQAPARTNPTTETQFLVEDGTIEFMIGGASGIVFAGDFVRVPAGMVYAYRNAGESDARLLCRTVSPVAMRRAVQVGASFAA